MQPSAIRIPGAPRWMLLLSLLFSWPASAGTVIVDALLDLDADPASGCTVTTVEGSIPGIDRILSTTLVTNISPPMVTGVTQQGCEQGAFGPPIAVTQPFPPPWPVGLGTGYAGGNVIESYLPVRATGVRFALRSSAPGGGEDALRGSAGIPIPLLGLPGIAALALAIALLALLIPARRARALPLLLLAFTAGAIPLAGAPFIPDGEVEEWAGTTPMPDAAGDAPVAVDILAGFVRVESGLLQVRIDLARNLPPVAADDQFDLIFDGTLTGNLLAPNPAQPDADPDGDALQVATVEGSALNLGATLTLPSGALLTVQADGGFTYDTNGAFDRLCSGAPASDRFQYEIADAHGYSAGASAAITVRGEPRTASVALEYAINGQSADEAPGVTVLSGALLSLSYQITNTGSWQLTALRLSDPGLGVIACPTDTLAAGADTTCTATTVALAGAHTQSATVTATARCGVGVTATDPASYTGIAPAITIEKRVNGEEADAAPGPTLRVGDPVSWSFVVTNSGDARLTGVTVSDDRAVAVTCPKTQLEAGESMTCTGAGTVVAGAYVNTGTATGMPPAGPAVSASDPAHYFGVAPAITIEKRVNGEEADAAPGPTLRVGDPVGWSFVVTNSGDARLTGVTVSDDRAVAVTCPKTQLEAGESMTCTGAGTVVAGSYVNIGSATGTPPAGPAVSASDPAYYLGISPAVTIEKRVNGEEADAAPGPTLATGDALLWTFVVTNSGDAQLTNVAVSDDRGVTVTCPKTTLQAGESMTCTGAGTVVAGSYVNIGTATGTPPAGPVVSASDPAYYFGISPAITIEKRVNGEEADAPPGPTLATGDALLWTFVVTNTGDAPLTNVAVSDDRGVTVTCPKTTLQAGESMTCTGAGTVVAGSYVNIGSVTGTPPAGPVVSASDPAHYFGQTANPQSCTPSFWKNNTDLWPPTGYGTTQRVDSVFSATSVYPAIASARLLEALGFAGGTGAQGAAEILLRAGTAALLNAAHPSVNYPSTPSAVIDAVNVAVSSQNRDTMLTTAAQLDAQNNLGCPLN